MRVSARRNYRRFGASRFAVRRDVRRVAALTPPPIREVMLKLGAFREVSTPMLEYAEKPSYRRAFNADAATGARRRPLSTAADIYARLARLRIYRRIACLPSSLFLIKEKGQPAMNYYQLQYLAANFITAGTVRCSMTGRQRYAQR